MKRSAMSYKRPSGVIVTDVSIPFSSIMVLVLKSTVASILIGLSLWLIAITAVLGFGSLIALISIIGT